jgi:hypothetical protein
MKVLKMAEMANLALNFNTKEDFLQLISTE